MTSINSLEIRRSLVDALQIDLIGPIGALGDHAEILPQSPSRWYLTGFLVPTDADEGQRCDPTSNDELDQAAEPAGIDDDDSPEKPAARRSYLPSSIRQKTRGHPLFAILFQMTQHVIPGRVTIDIGIRPNRISAFPGHIATTLKPVI